MRLKIDELSSKLTDMEDQSRHCNLRVVGLTEGGGKEMTASPF